MLLHCMSWISIFVFFVLPLKHHFLFPHRPMRWCWCSTVFLPEMWHYTQIQRNSTVIPRVGSNSVLYLNSYLLTHSPAFYHLRISALFWQTLANLINWFFFFSFEIWSQASFTNNLNFHISKAKSFNLPLKSLTFSEILIIKLFSLALLGDNLQL